MDQDPLRSSAPSSGATYHGFWPVLFIGMSLLLIFGWEVRLGIATRQGARQLQNQQMRAVDQAKQVQSRLEKLVRGLVELSKTNDAAKKLVTQFAIKVDDPTAPTSTPFP